MVVKGYLKSARSSFLIIGTLRNPMNCLRGVGKKLWSMRLCVERTSGGYMLVSSDGWLALHVMTLPVDGDHGPEPTTEMIYSLTHGEFITLANVDTYPFGTMSSSVTRIELSPE
jgi:hypothetical protein